MQIFLNGINSKDPLILHGLLSQTYERFGYSEEKKIETSGGRFEYNMRSVMSVWERDKIKERLDNGKRRFKPLAKMAKC